MTKEEALSVLDQATAAVSAPRAAHVQIQQALEVLKQLIDKEKTND